MHSATCKRQQVVLRRCNATIINSLHPRVCEQSIKSTLQSSSHFSSSIFPSATFRRCKPRLSRSKPCKTPCQPSTSFRLGRWSVEHILAWLAFFASPLHLRYPTSGALLPAEEVRVTGKQAADIAIGSRNHSTRPITSSTNSLPSSPGCCGRCALEPSCTYIPLIWRFPKPPPSSMPSALRVVALGPSPSRRSLPWSPRNT